MITPLQMRVARRALGLSMRALGRAVGLSQTSIHNYENKGSLSEERVEDVERYFRGQGVHFGPAQGVCFGRDEFKTSRELFAAAVDIAYEAGADISSGQIVKRMWEIRRQQGEHKPRRSDGL